MVGIVASGIFCAVLGVSSSSISHVMVLIQCRPQLDSRGIHHLCTSLDVKTIFVDNRYASKVTELADSHEILSISSLVDEISRATTVPPPPQRVLSEIAYFCHTSGTSSGLPKPIPQTHAGVVAAVPRLSSSEEIATFSTTPLYHGGLPDCFRAWASAASIWFFPEGIVPITAANICSAVNCVQDGTLKYFSSVPFVLQMLSEEEEGIKLLRAMDLVGVGGAPLATTTGDRLVRQAINLVSRMGSAECGFLMSSHRDYATDKDWQYLRPLPDSQLLSFEPRENGLSELVVRPGWPFRAKVNQGDGSYATSDLFEPHPTIPHAWKYHSRADAQIVLMNGKKFDPSPLEAAIVASIDSLRDVFIFGSGKEYPGIIIFPKDESTSKEAIIELVWPHISQMNDNSQSHARISKFMMRVACLPSHETALEKSSKGTVLRPPAEKKYAGIIDAAYTVPSHTPTHITANQDLDCVVMDCFNAILGHDIDPHRDVFQQGVDSIACVQLRKLLHSRLSISEAEYLPLNVIYDQGTVDGLVSYLSRTDRKASRNDTQDTHQQMRDLVEKYSKFERPRPITSTKPRRTVVLSGATGFLGSHILQSLRQTPTIEHIICLTRCRSRSEAHDKVSSAIFKVGLPDLSAAGDFHNILCLPSDMTRDSIGLAEHDLEQIKETALVFIHAAWSVNFALHLGSFEEQLSGVHNLMALAIESRARFVFVSSTAAVMASRDRIIEEAISDDPSDSSSLGYSQSKWVAEKICEAANNAMKVNGAGSNDVSGVAVVRVGQLCCNQKGVWNTAEAYPLLLSTAKMTGCLPDLSEERLSWMPVEDAAQSVLDIAFHDSNYRSSSETDGQVRGLPVYHIVNNSKAPSWKQMLQWLQSMDSQRSFEIVKPKEWMMRLEGALDRHPDHSCQALLGMWRKRYCEGDANQTNDEAIFGTNIAEEVSPTMRGLRAVDRERIEKLWGWVLRTS